MSVISCSFMGELLPFLFPFSSNIFSEMSLLNLFAPKLGPPSSSESWLENDASTSDSCYTNYNDKMFVKFSNAMSVSMKSEIRLL